MILYNIYICKQLEIDANKQVMRRPIKERRINKIVIEMTYKKKHKKIV